MSSPKLVLNKRNVLLKVGDLMVFDKMIEKLRNGIDIELETIDITEEFQCEYERYQERAKDRYTDKQYD